jgi:hypothetical protein
MKLTIINEEKAGGPSAVIQVDGFAEEILTPGNQVTIFVDADNEAVISEQQ